MDKGRTDNKTTDRKEAILRAEHVSKVFLTAGRRQLHAVSDVSLELFEGETLALVGESGCGKSTLGRMLLHLLPLTSGKVYYEGQEVSALSEKAFAPLRRSMQMVFQDPYASLDPRMNVRDIIAEPLEAAKLSTDPEEITRQVLRLMEMTGVPEEFLWRYPHQFSGGQRQRIGIARAIALQPKILVCDEPVSALDVSVQSQVLNLLKHLRQELNLTSLFIGHDLSVIHFIADRVEVMFLGHICEIAPKEVLYQKPLHPYTQFLLDSIPHPDPHLRDRERSLLKGEIPSPVDPPSGCCFSTRCPYATEQCKKEQPELSCFKGDHYVACHRVVAEN